MGRAFCLPVFSRSRKSKFKLEYKRGDSPVELVDQQDVVKDLKAEQEVSSSSCCDDQQEKVMYSDAQTVEAEVAEAAQQKSEAALQAQQNREESEAAQQNREESEAAQQNREESEAEVLAGHLSDPGFYCEERDFSESCATSECSQTKNGGGTSSVLGEDCHQFHAHEDYKLGEPHDGHGGEEIAAEVIGGEGPETAGIVTSVDESLSMKRVEEWVKSIASLSEPFIEIPAAVAAKDVVHHSRAASASSKEQEFANHLTRSLDFHSTTAHLSGIGLTVLPCLSAFSHLKTLNLSGNSIVRITPGALPKGLHSLDLSRNKISVIEGLRELTRLRSLNLSYNRILRIGQGLANCGSIRELHLAFNKINEVEGLHRLTKLAFLDLSYNRLASTKSLGQIAATHTSLMAINLLGNPVVLNVGEEQLKRFMTGAAPNLVYLNNQAVKGGASTRDAVVRSLMGMGSLSRHSPHHSTSSKMKSRKISSSVTTTTTAAAASSTTRRKDKGIDVLQSSGKRAEFDNVQDRLIARIQGIQRVKSDGALHDRDK